MKNLVILLAMLLCWPAFAEPKEPLVYEQTPLFYSTFTPKVAPCNYDVPAAMGVCGWKTYPTESTVIVTRRSEPSFKESIKIRMYMELVCVEGTCTDRYGAVQGILSGAKGTSYWEIPVGYYLTFLNGEYAAVKHGNGPFQELFPMRDVLHLDKLDGHYLHPDKTKDLYNVQCNLETDRCNYLGHEATLFEISLMVPFVRTATCDAYLCYIDGDRSKVAGVNPDRRDLYIGIR